MGQQDPAAAVLAFFTTEKQLHLCCGCSRPTRHPWVRVVRMVRMASRDCFSWQYTQK